MAGCSASEPAPTSPEAPAEEQVDASSQNIADLEADLAEKMETFEALFTTGEMGDAIDFLPPKVKAKLLESPDVTIAALKEGAQASWEESIETSPLESIIFDLNAYDVTDASNGHYYKRIPTIVLLENPENPNEISEVRSDTLAIYDADAWHIIRLNGEAHANFFKEVYPEYTDVEIDFPSEETRERGTE
jgi:hypothetical protein